MSVSLGWSDSDSSSSYNENVMSQQIPYLQNMWGNANNLFNMGMGYYPDMMGGGMDLMGSSVNQMNPYWEQMMQGGAYQNMDAQGDYNTAFNNLLNNQPSYTQDMYASIMGGQGNDYVDALEGSMRENQQETLGTSLATLDQRAGLMSGSSPWEGAMGNIVADSNRTLDSNLAKLGYDTFDKDLGMKLDIANMADTNWLTGAMHGLDSASGTLQNQNMAMGGGLDFGNNMFGYGSSQFMMPWQSSAYMPQFMPPVVLGSGSSGSSSSGIGFSL